MVELVEWTNEMSTRLIQEYQKRPELWNPDHEMYRIRPYKYESWRALAAEFECDVADLRKKLNSLFASYRREKAKVRAGQPSAWFLYPHMAFLPKHTDQANDHNNYVHITVPTKKPKLELKGEPGVEADEEAGEAAEEGASSEEYVDEEHLELDEELEPSPPPPPPPRPRPRVYPRQRHRPRPARRAPPSPPPASTSSLEARLAEVTRLLRRGGGGGGAGGGGRCKDECDSFGEYIADSLRKHDARAQAMIKQAINNIIFEQEMKKYGAGGSNGQYVVIAGIDENPLVLSDDGGK